MRFMLAVSDGIDGALERVARAIGWLFVVLMVVIAFDVLSRKAGFQLPYFGSTRLQELEWHLHAFLFLGWIGYCYVRNVHVRIDVFTARLDARQQAWLEIFGILCFAIPYMLVTLYFSYGFAMTSFLQNESSDAPNGLPYRWIVKASLFLGLVGVAFATISVLFRKLVLLFGSTDLADRAAGPKPSH